MTVSQDRTTEICALGVAELARLYRTRGLSPVDVVQATLGRIERLNPKLNAYLTVLGDSALSAARAAELQFGAGIDLGPLQGVPFSVKDVIRAKGTRTTAASKVLLDAPLDEEDALVVRKMRSNGAILIAKANLMEFALADPDDDGPFGSVQNPRRLGYRAGSSSSGSGSSVGAGLCVLSLGTDTGGSVRHPASVCGVVGLRPTYGLVPNKGVIPVAHQLDTVGPLGRSVADVASALTAIAGHDPDDPYSALVAIGDYSQSVGRDVRGLRVGIPTNPFFQFGQEAVLPLRERARDTLIELGLAPLYLELPRVEEAGNIVSGVVNPVDAAAYHTRYHDRAALYGRDFIKRTQRGREISAVEYSEAMRLRHELRLQWLALFEQVDLLFLPGNVATAPRVGEDMVEVDGKLHPHRTVNTLFNRIASFFGFPALSVPAGATPEGLPAGIQLVGPPFGEGRLLAVGHALEQALGNLPARWGIEPRP